MTAANSSSQSGFSAQAGSTTSSYGPVIALGRPMKTYGRSSAARRSMTAAISARASSTVRGSSGARWATSRSITCCR